MRADWGDEHWQRLLEDFVREYAYGEQAKVSIAAQGHLSKAEQSAVDRFLAFLRVASKQEIERVENYMAAQMELAAMSQPENLKVKLTGR